MPENHDHRLRAERDARLNAIPDPRQLNADGAGSENELTYGDLLHLLWRRKWGFLFVVALCLGACVAYLRRATPLYQSSARLCIEPGGRGLLGDGGAAQPANYLFVQAELIRSPAIVDGAVARIAGAMPAALKGSARPTQAIRGGLKVDVDKTDDSIIIQYTSPNPSESALVVNAVVDSYTEYQAQKSRSAAAEVVRILQKEKDAWDAKREEQLRAMTEFKRANGSLSAEGKVGSLVLAKLQVVLTELTAAQMEAMEARALEAAVASSEETSDRLMALLERHGNSAALMAASPSLAAIDRDIGAARQEWAYRQQRARDVEATLGPNHPQMAAAQRLVDEAAAALPALERRKVTAIREMIHARAVTAAEKEQQLSAAFERQQQQALGLNVKAADYARLEADLARTERLSDLLDTRIKDIVVSRDLSAPKVTVLEPAAPADAPSEPKVATALAIALGVGLAAGFACALTIDWADQRLWAARDVRTRLQLPVLGVVPHMRGRRRLSVIGRTVEVEPMSAFAEACRALRTAVFFGMPAGGARCLLVTSAVPGEGKSVTAANLAIAMGQAGSRTLLVDADLRSPSQHEIFSVDNDRGVATVLGGGATWDEVIKPATAQGLDLLTAGPSPSNPSEMLNSRQFEDLLVQLAERYDRVVLDSPPVKMVTDPCVLAVLCDATVVVFRAARSTRRDAEEAVEALQSLGVNLIGGIVNDMPLSSGQYTLGYPYKGGRWRRGSTPPRPMTKSIVLAERR